MGGGRNFLRNEYLKGFKLFLGCRKQSSGLYFVVGKVKNLSKFAFFQINFENFFFESFFGTCFKFGFMLKVFSFFFYSFKGKENFRFLNLKFLWKKPNL
ncbi:MAG: hypothetical protein CM15mP64_6240 [Candidatus Neomarinimicrobiota bacterium]|nr:MAG: hypothetical protein CM15mP64_6240 [Candidatus Neomarinimicrobiota bacterium]